VLHSANLALNCWLATDWRLGKHIPLGLELTEYQVSCGQTHILVKQALKIATWQFNSEHLIGGRLLQANSRLPAFNPSENWSMKTRLSDVKIRRDYYRSKVTIRRKMASLRVCSQRRQLRRAARAWRNSWMTCMTALQTGIGLDRYSSSAQRWCNRSGDKFKEDPPEIGGRLVSELIGWMGWSLFFADGSWLLMRPSGTEPVVRIYAESESATDLEVLLEQGHKFLLGWWANSGAACSAKSEFNFCIR